uniref:Interphotoreceptor matrix proteoglycan 2b n=1 Tax=Seriola lalandi dorsalis TaxID=1841481 RepID=A0A3B4Y987_SERLL
YSEDKTTDTSGPVRQQLQLRDNQYSGQLLYRRHAALTRRKRNILFPSGVKLCTQETFDQAVTNHLSYFHLRVCQETVWEAFKIFWDRLPERDEYQDWVGRCMDGSVSVMDIGSFFSQSEEHIDLIRKQLPEEAEGATVTVEEPGEAALEPVKTADTQEDETTIEPTGEPTDGGEETPDAPIEPVEEETEETVEEPEPAEETVVELSIKLRGETYNDALRDPSSFHYQQLIEDAFERLPGFKNVYIVEFRGLVVLVHYAITLEVDSGGIANDTLDFISLQNNLVEKNYPGAAEQPTVVYTITDFRNYITEALHKDNFMTNSSLEAQADPLQLQNGTIRVVDTQTDDRCWWKQVFDVIKMMSHTQDSDLGPVMTCLWCLRSRPEALHVFFCFTDSGNIEDEGFLLNNAPGAVDDAPRGDHAVSPGGSSAALKPQTGSESTLDDGSGSGFSGDGQGADLWSWQPPAELEVLTDKPKLLLPEAADQEEVEILEEQHIDSSDATAAAEPPLQVNRDLVADEVMVVTTTAAPDPTSSVSSDRGGGGIGIALSPEKDSPFTRVSDSVPEDEDLLHHEHLNHEDVDEIPVSAPPSDVAPGLTVGVTNKTGSAVIDAAETSPWEPEQDVDLVTTDTEIQVFEQDFSDMPSIDVSFDVFQYGGMATEGDSSGFSSGAQGSDLDAIALPTRPGRALTVFFSLRVTNMAFSMDLFNKSSPEYKALEQRFLQLLVPYLESNLNNFQNLEILNFRNGSIVVNSRMRFGKPVPRGVTNVVYLILEDFANTAYQTMNLAIDKYSLDVESGDRADPCKFQACNEFSRCMVNRWSGEAECVCDAGYLSVDGLPCQSVCEVQHDFCLNDGKCDIIPGKGAICRCRVGENWWYRGEHCEEYVSEPLVVGIAIASVVGFLMVAAGIIFFLARTLNIQCKDLNLNFPSSRRGDSVPTLERATKFNPMFESDPHYRRRDPNLPEYSSSASVDSSRDVSSEEIRHIYQNTSLTKEEIQERLRIIELCSRDQHFADFVRQTQV